ncbi:hypothetical protein ATANTOWER_012029 [Ataeniobius toweri]|uniref:Uncharacterized protein n=1 Tax=Ataeniobius toweri TaxID=208326 RepID=A0ABU7C7Q4_9TELE|nr:hypothetical protein [Ataeniobius toweri]
MRPRRLDRLNVISFSILPDELFAVAANPNRGAISFLFSTADRDIIRLVHTHLWSTLFRCPSLSQQRPGSAHVRSGVSAASLALAQEAFECLLDVKTREGRYKPADEYRSAACLAGEQNSMFHILEKLPAGHNLSHQKRFKAFSIVYFFKLEKEAAHGATGKLSSLKGMCQLHLFKCAHKETVTSRVEQPNGASVSIFLKMKLHLKNV